MPPSKERTTIKVQSEKAVVAAVRLPGDRFDEENPFGEIAELAKQAGAIVVAELDQRKDRPEAGTYMGRGKLDELRALCQSTDATTIIFDHDLSPKQIAKIEEITERKVLDRSELILDIFASRATTHEAKLQVELAQLEYTYPRLRAMWSHLERIVGAGGIGGVGTRGPGEQQLEIDRRLVQQRRDALKRELSDIQARKARSVSQRKSEHFTVGIVGYTNAGKSTLFNTLTAGGAYADDRLFATLMTRTRAWDLGGGEEVMLSDTVGFVRDLPHNLVASFRATLEEATHADLLLLVLDVSDPAAELHYETVTSTLDSLFDERDQLSKKAGEDPEPRPERIVLLNKADALRDNRALLTWTSRVPGAIPFSALPDNEGIPKLGSPELTERTRRAVQGPIVQRTVEVPLREAKAISTLENKGEVLDREYDADKVRLTLRVGARLLDRYAAASVLTIDGQQHTTSEAERGWKPSEEEKA